MSYILVILHAFTCLRPCNRLTVNVRRALNACEVQTTCALRVNELKDKRARALIECTSSRFKRPSSNSRCANGDDRVHMGRRSARGEVNTLN